MTVLDVLLYGDTANPAGVPSAWPFSAQERPDDAPPPAAPLRRMSIAEFEAQRSQNQPAFDAWALAQPAPATPLVSRVPRYFAKLALSQQSGSAAGRTLLDDAQAVATAVGGAALLAFNEADSWGRYDQVTVQLANAIGLTTDAQIDALFRVAESLCLQAQLTG